MLNPSDSAARHVGLAGFMMRFRHPGSGDLVLESRRCSPSTIRHFAMLNTGEITNYPTLIVFKISMSTTDCFDMLKKLTVSESRIQESEAASTGEFCAIPKRLRNIFAGLLQIRHESH